MSTLDRYILNTFARNLALVLLTLISLYSLIEFMEKVDDFIEQQAALKYYVTYPLQHLPVIIFNSLPMAVLLATFVTIGGFSRSNQLTAILSGGVSFSRICRPLFFGSLILAAIAMLANLWFVPWSSRESRYMWSHEIKGNAAMTGSGKDLYFRDGNRIISVNQAFPEKNVVLGLTIVEFNDKFMPVKRIQADHAEHKRKGHWLLNNAVIWEFDPETRAVVSFVQQPEIEIDLNRRPDEMLLLWDRPEDLAVGELLQLSDKLQQEGYDPKAYQVEVQGRFAKAAIPIIMVLVGIPFSLQRGRNTSFSLGIVISLIIFAVYFMLDAVFTVFGAIAVLPPPVAAWAANILMALIGTWFFLKLES